MTTHSGFGGYSLNEIKAIFDLSEQDLTKKILIYGAGASSIDIDPYQQKLDIVFADPLYQFPPDKIEKIIEAKYQALKHDFKTKPASAYAWQYFSSPEQALATFKKNADIFLRHFTEDKKNKTYISCSLPNLPFTDNEFDIILCIDHLFRTTLKFTAYLELIKELNRVANDIRVFPLIDQNGQLFSNIGQLMLNLQQKGYGIELKHSDFVLQEKGDAVLKIWPQTCTL